ncbi:hypothetical protein PROFUN_11100 [Planoprotostelium fungivorum]|uniref:Uncharacterized protein n=1 Tax=Planoprotostelium fungivorum TaxID=1890364 RepID=A0A2P6NAK7_9EUKA|nr:hypothetical protein PROFUN_11100 [Planoprotostelium fungivorum]
MKHQLAPSQQSTTEDQHSGVDTALVQQDPMSSSLDALSHSRLLHGTCMDLLRSAEWSVVENRAI